MGRLNRRPRHDQVAGCNCYCEAGRSRRPVLNKANLAATTSFTELTNLREEFIGNDLIWLLCENSIQSASPSGPHLRVDVHSRSPRRVLTLLLQLLSERGILTRLAFQGPR